MKKVLFSLALLMGASTMSFAQVKVVKEAKSAATSMTPDFNKAEQLIAGALTNDETKNDPNTWNVAGLIQKGIYDAEIQKAYLQQPFDTIRAYNGVLNMFQYYLKCDELAQIPNEKGKIKNKYRKNNAAAMLQNRGNLINGGIQYFNLNDNAKAMKFFGTYVESASYDMLAKENLAAADTLLPQIAYYAELAASNAGEYDAVIKYSKIAINDKENGAVAMQLASDALKNKGETEAWLKSLEDGILKYPQNPYFFANLVDYYSNNGQAEKAMAFADKMLESEPNNKLFLYVKGYLYHTLEDFDNAIVYYKKAIEQDPEYAEAYANLGLVLLLQAQDFADATTTDVSDPAYAEAQAKLKKYYEEARPYYEKTRELRPDNKDLWLQGLYRIYYNLNMGPEFEEMEKMMQ